MTTDRTSIPDDVIAACWEEYHRAVPVARDYDSPTGVGIEAAMRLAYAAGRAERVAVAPVGDPLDTPLNDLPNAPTIRQVRDRSWIEWGRYLDASGADKHVAARRAADTVPLLVSSLDRLRLLSLDSAAPDWPPATPWPDRYRRLVLGQE